MSLKKYYLLFSVLISQVVFSQEGIPVYADYLSDNLYLVHPAMAGASNANKVRLTARKQWFGVPDAPNLQTLNINFRTGEKMGLGAIVFRDKNGRFSQTGVYLTTAYHLLFSRDRTDLNMLSFGISGGLIQSNLDLRGLEDITDPDPVILDRKQKDVYLNMDVGLSYHYLEWYAHFTAKNILPITRSTFDNNTPVKESNNQRKYVFSFGRLFELGSGAWSIEPSFMYQLREETLESSADVNLKVYRDFDFGMLWGGVSYRNGFDGAQFSDGGVEIQNQKSMYITPFIGGNYKKWMLGYTYSHQINSVVITKSGFHQLTLGYDFGKRKERWNCKCPAIN